MNKDTIDDFVRPKQTGCCKLIPVRSWLELIDKFQELLHTCCMKRRRHLLHAILRLVLVACREGNDSPE
jgi:hypothetical protein